MTSTMHVTNREIQFLKELAHRGVSKAGDIYYRCNDFMMIGSTPFPKKKSISNVLYLLEKNGLVENLKRGKWMLTGHGETILNLVRAGLFSAQPENQAASQPNGFEDEPEDADEQEDDIADDFASEEADEPEDTDEPEDDGLADVYANVAETFKNVAIAFENVAKVFAILNQ